MAEEVDVGAVAIDVQLFVVEFFAWRILELTAWRPDYLRPELSGYGKAPDPDIFTTTSNIGHVN